MSPIHNMSLSVSTPASVHQPPAAPLNGHDPGTVDAKSRGATTCGTTANLKERPPQEKAMVNPHPVHSGNRASLGLCCMPGRIRKAPGCWDMGRTRGGRVVMPNAALLTVQRSTPPVRPICPGAQRARSRGHVGPGHAAERLPPCRPANSPTRKARNIAVIITLSSPSSGNAPFALYRAARGLCCSSPVDVEQQAEHKACTVVLGCHLNCIRRPRRHPCPSPCAPWCSTGADERQPSG